MRAVFALLSLLLLAACAADMTGPPPPDTVGQVDLRRYAGTWYEIARLPNRFQDGRGACIAAQANYVPQEDGKIRVVNTCRDLSGEVQRAEGWARPVSPGNDKLRVTFQWPFSGDYWVIGLDPGYRWAVVGTPERDNLWILSRDPALPAGDYIEALAIARQEGFDTASLQPTPQPGATVAAPPRAPAPPTLSGALLDRAKRR